MYDMQQNATLCPETEISQLLRCSYVNYVNKNFVCVIFEFIVHNQQQKKHDVPTHTFVEFCDVFVAPLFYQQTFVFFGRKFQSTI